MTRPNLQSPLVGEWSSQGQKQKGLFIANEQMITYVEFCSYFYDYGKRHMLWIYGQTVNIPWNILWSVNSPNIPWDNGNNLQCINHKVIEEEQVKKRSWPLAKDMISEEKNTNQNLTLLNYKENKVSCALTLDTRAPGGHASYLSWLGFCCWVNTWPQGTWGEKGFLF